MNEARYTLASSGALTLRLLPENNILRLTTGATVDRLSGVLIRRRRTGTMEGIMHPDSHNFLTSPAKGTTLNAGQFGGLFAQLPCKGCAEKGQSYDALTPARPQKAFRKAIASLFSRAGK